MSFIRGTGAQEPTFGTPNTTTKVQVGDLKPFEFDFNSDLEFTPSPDKQIRMFRPDASFQQSGGDGRSRLNSDVLD